MLPSERAKAATDFNKPDHVTQRDAVNLLEKQVGKAICVT